MLTRRTLLAAVLRPRQYIVASGLGDESPPPEVRLPFGWRGIAVRDKLTLNFPRAGNRMRITNALDSRELRILEVRTENGRVLGSFDLRYAYAGQIFELVLPENVRRVQLRRTQGTEPTWIFTGGPPTPLLPHLLKPTGNPAIREFHRRLRGIESVQPFGWMDGCVLDALDDLAYSTDLDRHLNLFLPDERILVYEDPRSRPIDNRFASIEETLPLGVIARKRPAHAALDIAIRFWLDHRDAEGCVLNGGLTSTEGSYTVAYPMAAVAQARRDRDLEELALRQLRIRRHRLTQPGAIFLRRNSLGETSFRNWSRGIAWYVLGLARTLEVLADRDDTADLKEELKRSLALAIEHQRPDGLWNCFVDAPATGAETSGTAGIAAALAKAARLGVADNAGRTAADRTRKALQNWLTPDGLLGGVAQSNRGGEELQRSGYRVLSPMAMGLFGQLIAALDGPGRHS